MRVCILIFNFGRGGYLTLCTYIHHTFAFILSYYITLGSCSPELVSVYVYVYV